MEVTIEQAGSLLNQAGYRVTVVNKHLKQVVPPYEGYEEVKKDGEKWVYRRVFVERTNTPYTQTMKEFVTEEEAATYYFLRSLSSHYNHTIVTPFKLKHKIDFHQDISDVTLLCKSLQAAGVPKNRFYFNKSPVGTCMHLSQINDSEWKKSLVSDGRVVISLMPFDDFAWGVFAVFIDTFLLHLFLTEVPKLLQSEGITEQLTDEEMSIFMFG
ncbi:hypothetical protein NSQ26_04660 [Bacillus sp. FSL W7-1360]